MNMKNITSAQEKMREKHTLLEWMVILQNDPELMAEFEKECDKQCPPPPIR